MAPFQKFFRREPVNVLKIDMNGGRLTLDRLKKDGPIVYDILKERAYAAPDTVRTSWTRPLVDRARKLMARQPGQDLQQLQQQQLEALQLQDQLDLDEQLQDLDAGQDQEQGQEGELQELEQPAGVQPAARPGQQQLQDLEPSLASRPADPPGERIRADPGSSRPSPEDLDAAVLELDLADKNARQVILDYQAGQASLQDLEASKARIDQAQEHSRQLLARALQQQRAAVNAPGATPTAPGPGAPAGRVQLVQGQPARPRGIIGGLRARAQDRRIEQAQQVYTDDPELGSTILELRSNVNIKRGQVLKVQLLDEARGCSVALKPSNVNEFIEWCGDPNLFGSLIASGSVQTVLQRRVRIGTAVIIFLGGLLVGLAMRGGL